MSGIDVDAVCAFDTSEGECCVGVHSLTCHVVVIQPRPKATPSFQLKSDRAWYAKSREQRHEHMINNERANKKLEVSHKRTSNNGNEVQTWLRTSPLAMQVSFLEPPVKSNGNQFTLASLASK